jgi:hypothetical protein
VDDYRNCKITMKHVMDAKIETPDHRGYCVRGMRAFARANGLDFGKFAREGLPYSAFESFKNDVMVDAVLQEAVRQWVAQAR